MHHTSSDNKMPPWLSRSVTPALKPCADVGRSASHQLSSPMLQTPIHFQTPIQRKILSLRAWLRDALPPCVAPRGARAAFQLALTVLLSWVWLRDALLTRLDLHRHACHAPCPTENKNLPPRHSAPAALASPCAPRLRLLRTRQRSKRSHGHSTPAALLSRLARVFSAPRTVGERSPPTPRATTQSTAWSPGMSRFSHLEYLHMPVSFSPCSLARTTFCPARKKKVLPPSVCCVVLGRGRHLLALARRTVDASRTKAAVLDPVCSD